MKKVWIFALLLCLGIAGCGGRGNTAAPEAGTPEATKVVTEADPETEPVTEPAARIPGTAGEAPQPDQAWLPSLPIESAEEDCAHYRVEDEAAIEAYVERMEAAGFRRRDFDRRYLLWNDRVILEMVGEQAYEMEDYTYEGDPDRWTLRWQIAGPGAAPVDLAAVRAFLPGDELLCAVDQTPAGMYEATGLRLLGCAFLNVPSVMPGVRLLSPGDAVVFCQLLLGPDGCTVPGSYYSIPPQEALWTDVDDDGELEFVYWTYGPTSGLFTVALWAYGLEQGLPVLKAETIYNLDWSDELGLDLENGLPVFRTATRHFDQSLRDFVTDEHLRIPLRVETGSFVPAEGELPESIQVWGGQWGGQLFSPYGASFSVLREVWGNSLVFQSPHCLISHTGNPFTGVQIDYIWAAVSADGIRVTGYCMGDGDGWKRFEALEPIPAQEDLTALAALSPEAVLAQLGPAHFDDGDGGAHQWGWITEDGKLLRITAEQRVLLVSLFDPLTKKADEAGPLAMNYWSPDEQPDLIVIREDVPSTLLNAKRWDDFLASAAAGTPDAVRLLLVYSSGAFLQELRYDGRVFTLTGAGREQVYSRLITSPEDRPRNPAACSAAIHYLLSEDPDMTWERYFSHMVSSVRDPDFPPTETLFTVYRK